MTNILRSLLATAVLLVVATTTHAIDWPQEVVADGGRIIVYQPQPEGLDGNRLTGRAAMSIMLDGSDEQIFGTFWFDGRLDTDRNSDTATVSDLRVTQVRWPESKDAGEQRFTAVVENAIPDSGFEISLERLTASLATAELETASLDNLNNEPPVIVFRQSLAVLLSYDGEPRYAAIDNSDYERVLNTPIAVVRDQRGRHYLTNGKLWYVAEGALGPWAPTDSPPQDLVRGMPGPSPETADWPLPPEIVVATEPTELIVTDGAPEWRPLAGGDLLYVTNTESPWLRDVSTGNMYLLLSGRWYRAKSTQGPWTFVRSDELPPAFADIPPASDIGGLRTSVAGTPEADEAVLDAQIPQTAAISRDAALAVTYDGAPKFEKISGTSVAYAVNTATQVLQIDGRYYAVDDGVWFTAPGANGPWTVADEIPRDKIAEIPPSSPVYNTTYVHVYESTPEVVYVGYTPGYLWSFPYYGVPVYGSGWYYRPYPGPWYYPRPPTWGLHVGYNPWTGWNFGMSWSNGFFSFGVSWGGGYNHYHPGGWYGGGYRGPVVINTGDINIGNNINVGNRTDIGNRLRDSDLGINRDSLRRDNLYNRPENRNRMADRSAVKRDYRQAVAKRDLPNNVFADRDGRVSRNVNDTWETREAGGWKADDTLNRPGTREAARPARPEPPAAATRDFERPSSRPATVDRRQDLERAKRSRNTGMQRERSRPVAHHQMQQRPQNFRRR